MSLVLRQLASIAINNEDEVGGWLTDRELVVLPNRSIDPANSYIPSHTIPDGTTFWHSHRAGGFSQQDILGIWQSSYPWLVFDKSTLTFYRFGHNDRRMYLGRTWIRGLSDCYCLVRDWYRHEIGWEMPTPLFYLQGGNIAAMVRTILKEKFTPVTGDIQSHDLCIWMDREQVAHLGVAIELNNQMKILHHPEGQLSKIADIRDIEKCRVYRHNKLNLDSSATWGYNLGINIASKQIDLERSQLTAATSLMDLPS